jgi:hypothetical protein
MVKRKHHKTQQRFSLVRKFNHYYECRYGYVIRLNVAVLKVVMLSATLVSRYAKHRYAECRNAERHFKNYHYGECRYVEYQLL